MTAAVPATAAECKNLRRERSFFGEAFGLDGFRGCFISGLLLQDSTLLNAIGAYRDRIFVASGKLDASNPEGRKTPVADSVRYPSNQGLLSRSCTIVRECTAGDFFDKCVCVIHSRKQGLEQGRETCL